MQKLRFLIVRLRAIGDALISTCLAETLKVNYPNAQVDYVVYQNCAAVLENNPLIDHVIVVPGGKNKSTLQMLKVLRFLRKQRYDYVIDVINTPKSLVLSKLIGAKKTIGAYENKRRNCFYDIRVRFDEDFLPDSNASITVKRNLQLLAPISDDLAYIDRYKICFSDEEINKAKRVLRQSGVDITQPFIFFGINNSMPEIKSWSLDNFAHVIDVCHQDYGMQTVSYPGPGELTQDNQLRTKLSHPEQHVTITNESLRELAVIIKLSALFIGNDSAPMHIALAADTPSISLFAPQVNHLDWHPRSNLKHQVMSIQSVLDYSAAEYNAFLDSFDFKYHAKWYEKITVEKIVQQLSNFID